MYNGDIFTFFQDLDFQQKIFFEFCFVKTLKFTYNWNEIKNIYSKHSLFPAFCIPGCVMFVYSLKRFLINRAMPNIPSERCDLMSSLWIDSTSLCVIMPKRTGILVSLFIKNVVCSFWEVALCLFTFTFWPIESIVTTHSWRVKFQLHSLKTKFEIINSIKEFHARNLIFSPNVKQHSASCFYLSHELQYSDLWVLVFIINISWIPYVPGLCQIWSQHDFKS